MTFAKGMQSMMRGACTPPSLFIFWLEECRGHTWLRNINSAG